MPVWARATETRKDNPILTDITACRIIDSVDFDFSTMTNNLKEINQISWIARCKRGDLVIGDFIKRNPNGVIVNIGCGLDTTYERINNPQILWYDLDLPDVIELRKKILQESDKRKFIASSFMDTQWFNIIPEGKNVLFLAMGVFVYFEESLVKEFLIQVTGRFSGSELFFDVTSPKGVQVANKVIEKSGLDSNSFFKWGLSSTKIFKSWDPRLTLIEEYYTFKFRNLELSLKNKILGFLSDAAKVQYMVHLKIN